MLNVILGILSTERRSEPRQRLLICSTLAQTLPTYIRWEIQNVESLKEMQWESESCILILFAVRTAVRKFFTLNAKRS